MRNETNEKAYNAISNASEMVDFLRARAQSHRVLHFHTTLSVLWSILSKGYVWLSRLDAMRLNDRHECEKKGIRDIVRRTFIWCLAHGGERYENAALWMIYGRQRADAVRISIPAQKLVDLSMEISSGKAMIYPVVKPSGTEIVDETPIDNAPVAGDAIDVVYVGDKEDGPKAYCWEDLYRHDAALDDIDKSAELTGCVKHFGWRNERETRLRVRFADEIRVSGAAIDRIAVKLPKDFFDGAKIVLSPWRDTDKDVENEFSDIFPQGCRTSQFEGMLNF